MSIPVLDDVVAAVSPLIESLSHLTGGPAAAIVLCTAALRLALLPLTLAAVRGERARAALAPRAAELRRAHADDPARYAAELTALHRDAGVSLFAGVLPMLAQAPFLLLWYRIFSTGLLSGTLLGAPLSAHLTAAPLAFLPLVAVLVALGVVTAWRSRRVAAATGNPPPPALIAALPLLSAVTALFLPLAAALYLTTTVAWSTGESFALRRGLPARSAPAG
ncbi:membrane protein insertase YidC [Spirilliplanes yamanashiensis]|uniref:Membrane protein insertase YidC n=1 Tax=Spirilliplanes yamanashiensis TaxID=42233 RepID=A0A8J3YB34_9ACTN|nr:membrane protein insertase YidC [Spirilliplanes yamanashiensis]MDP9818976.1 YidC/Oxa1 family membrane protein insertase [Spirilliplanes yamanashiensis]GIJ05431.1 hypothetical protein Sya03_47830 [Spirilliplanes yamanashiensis]